jgi:glutamine synthetase adenylyltransferase
MWRCSWGALICIWCGFKCKWQNLLGELKLWFHLVNQFLQQIFGLLPVSSQNTALINALWNWVWRQQHKPVKTVLVLQRHSKARRNHLDQLLCITRSAHQHYWTNKVTHINNCKDTQPCHNSWPF